MAETNITELNFKSEVLESELPVLADFWAVWCAPCSMVATILTSIAAENEGKLKVVKINIDENEALVRAYGITGIPTLMLFKEGKAVNTLVGVRSKQDILTALGI